MAPRRHKYTDSDEDEEMNHDQVRSAGESDTEGESGYSAPSAAPGSQQKKGATKKRGRSPSVSSKGKPTDTEDGDSDEHDEDGGDESTSASASTSSRKRARSTRKRRGSGLSASSKSKKKAPPPPTMVEGVETWSVNRIMAEDQDDTGEVVYLIKWDGYTGADTWEPFDSIASCHAALAEWRTEKRAILAATRACDLVAGAPDSSLGMGYPIHHRSESKVRKQKRSFLSDQEWQLKQIAKAEKKDAKRKDAERKAARIKKLKEREAILLAKKAPVQEIVYSKESALQKKKREESERRQLEAERELVRKRREAELNCTEPYYFVTADDSLLMTCIASDEEEEWGVGAAKKVLADHGRKATTKKARFQARPIPKPSKHSATGTPQDEKTEDDESSPDVMDLTCDASATSGRAGAVSGGSSNSVPARNTMAIDAEEWSDDDLALVGDSRGEDAKLKRFAAQTGAEEVQDIIDMREIASASADGADAALASLSDRYEYLVRWKPATLRGTSWEVESSLKGAQSKLAAFLEKKKRAGWRPPTPPVDEDEENESQADEEEDMEMKTNYHAEDAPAMRKTK